MPRFAIVPLLLVVTAAGAASPSGSVRATRLTDVVVTETTGTSLRDASVVTGVPFARGQLRDPVPPAHLLWQGEQAPAVANARVLERWPDGSIRWLLVDRLGSVPAHGRVTHTLGVGADAGPSARASLVTETIGEGVRSESPGFLALTVLARGPTLASLRLPDERDPIVIPWPALRVDGATLPPPEVDGVAIETRGEVQDEIVVRARHADGLRHEVRFATFARQPVVRVRYTLTHMGEAPYLHLAALPLRLPWHATHAEFAIDGRIRSFPFTGPRGTHALVHDDAEGPLLDGQVSGRHADGVARVIGDGKTWSVVVPAFWQEYPKSLTVSTHGIDVDFVAAERAPLLFGVGAAKTWELWIAVHGAKQAPQLVQLGRSLSDPPHGFVAPSWAAQSGALAYAIAPTTPGAAAFLATLRPEIDRYRARAMAERWDDGPPGACAARRELQVHLGFYGALNWGDWNFPGFRDETKGCDAWGNLEYDLPLVLGLAYLATGAPEVWTLFGDASRHYRDVDVIHHWPGHAERVGLNHPHKVRHFATDARGTTDLGHVWLDGLLLHYRLTGEQRSREAVVRMADALVGLTGHAHNPRQFGWPMVALAAAFEATGDARYRAASLDFAAQAARRFPPDPNAEWKMGILAEGMMAVHRATGDADVRRWLDDYGRQLLVPAPSPRDPRLVIPAGYLFELTNDTRYADLARTTAERLSPGNWGKPLASTGRVGFALLGPLARHPAALTRAPVAPRPPSGPGSPRSSPAPATPSRPSDR